MNKKAIVAAKLKELIGIVAELETEYPNRKFTLDGHLVGSIGEVLAAEKYNLTLLPNSTETHDAVDQSDRMIQIKTTQINSIALSSEPDYLLIQKLLKNGTVEKIYFGHGKIVWDNCGKMQKNGQRRISLSRLIKLGKDNQASESIK